MRFVRVGGIVASLAVVFGGFVVSRASAQNTNVLVVEAYIDGQSRLILNGNTAQWHHLRFDAPGLWFANEPTVLNDQPWFPVWPATTFSCDCFSLPLSSVTTPLSTSEPTLVSLKLVSGRGTASVIQQPSSSNNYTAIVEFDDREPGGAAWYKVELTYGPATYELKPVQPPTPTFICPTEICLYTWGETASAASGAPNHRIIGQPSTGFNAFGVQQTSSFTARSLIGAPMPQTPSCLVFDSPKAPSFLQPRNAICGANGSLTGSMFGEAGFGTLKAYAGLNALMYTGEGQVVHAVAGGADVVGFQDDLRDPEFTPRVARFRFHVHGDVNSVVSPGAKGDGGFFFRGGGSPCFGLSCVGVAQDWLGPYASTRTVTIDIDYVTGAYFSALFELDAAAMAASASGAAFDAEVTANFDATATLERIQIFEGTHDNLGSEITRFSISSQSGTNYNEYLGDTAAPSLAVPASIITAATSSSGRQSPSRYPRLMTATQNQQ